MSIEASDNQQEQQQQQQQLSRRTEGVVYALYAGHKARWSEYQPWLLQSFQTNAGLQETKVVVNLSNNNDEYPPLDPTLVHVIIYAPNGPIHDFSPYTNLKAVLCLWAGVEGIVHNPTLHQAIPLCRMVDPGLKRGMVEYVVGHVFRYHLQMDDLWQCKQRQEWRRKVSLSGEDLMPLANSKTIGILGCGELGLACAQALLPFQFQVLGWARRPRDNNNNTATAAAASQPSPPPPHHPPPHGLEWFTGPDGLDQVLSRADILIVLLPHTPATENLLDAPTLFQKCKPGVAIINVGRGSVIDDTALLTALEQGIVSGATLDVFRTEPLPLDHGYWKDPRVLITPHIAAKTRAETAAPVIAENIRRCVMGESPLYVVDRAAGY
jgi:glyoxylate/hydroxypyruvate reductase